MFKNLKKRKFIQITLTIERMLFSVVVILKKNIFKGTARVIHSALEHFELIRTERLKPSSNPDGSVTFSMALFRRLYNSLRLPGEQMDSIVCHFKTESEGVAPKNIIILGRGRIFSVNFFRSDGTIMNHRQILDILTEISDIIDRSGADDVPIPVLTCDDRSSWAVVRTTRL